MAKRRKYKRRYRKKESLLSGFIKRAVRAGLSIVVLSAFVLGIAFFVKQVATFNTDKFASLSKPYASKIGLEEQQIGEVAGEFIKRLTDIDIENMLDGVSTSKLEGEKEEEKQEGQNSNAPQPADVVPLGKQVLSFAIVADSHVANDKQDYINNKDHLNVALSKAKELGVGGVIHVGDITNWGVLSDLKEAKKYLDESELKYYALPGDRDLAQAVGNSAFVDVFGKGNQTFELNGYKFVLLDNSANYTLIPKEDMDWFANQVTDADFVILSQPLYTEGLVLFNYLYMGSSEELPENESLVEKQRQVKVQRDILLEQIQNSNVKAVVAGDHHKSSQLTDGVRPSLTHYVCGALTETISEYAQSVLQSQRFCNLKVFENGSFVVEDILLY